MDSYRGGTDAANRATSDILVGLRHELLTPLNGIIGLAELLERQHSGPLTERQRTYARNIHACGWRLVSLVNDIIDISKIDLGRLSLSREWMFLDPVIEAVEGDSRPLADKRKVALTVSLQPGLPKVLADPARIKQILQSLVSTALNFAPKGGSVWLTACADQAGISICVADIGTGVKAEEARRLFHDFEPAENVFENGQLRAGLGLPLARRLAELHGGRLEVCTEAGRGSALRLTIPLNHRSQPSVAVFPNGQAPIEKGMTDAA